MCQPINCVPNLIFSVFWYGWGRSTEVHSVEPTSPLMSPIHLPATRMTSWQQLRQVRSVPAVVPSIASAAPLVLPMDFSSVVPTPWEPSISAFLASVLLRGAPGCTSSRCAVWPAFCPTKSKRQRLDAAAWVEAGPKQVAATAVIMVCLWFISHSSLKKGFEIDGVPIPVRTLTVRVVHYHLSLRLFVFQKDLRPSVELYSPECSCPNRLQIVQLV